MDIFFSITNTLLLIILFFYQRNRNIVLTEQLSAQQKLIDETKSVVMQQATALQSQSKVVESALQYSESFNPDKLESILRREFMIEHKEEIQ